MPHGTTKKNFKKVVKMISFMLFAFYKKKMEKEHQNDNIQFGQSINPCKKYFIVDSNYPK